ncbi:MAG: hypothetical protein AAGA29_11420 [Planctomycetota bacterium]
MTDRYDQDLLLDYLEGDLDPAARAQVDQMLAGDPQLASLMQSLAQDRAMLREMPAEDAPGDLSFDLVQGLERRMLLDAPQVEAGGPIPIGRGRGMAPPTGGVRWGRIVGLTGMAAAIALAAGAVIWFDRFNPLSQTALELGQPTNTPAAGEAEPADSAADALMLSELDNATAGGSGAFDDTTPGSLTSPGTSALHGVHDENPASLAERARRAMLDGAANRAGGPSVSSAAGAPGRPDEADTLELSPPESPIPSVTITAFTPDQALRIESDNQETSKAEVLEWCLRNGVPIVEPQLDRAAEQAQADAPPIAILIEPTQLDALLSDLNRETIQQQQNRQRAIIDPADESYYQQAEAVPHLADEDAEAFDTTRLGNDDASPAIVELRVPADLGDAVQTRLNVANTLLYSNRAELALAAQRDAEVIRNQQIADETQADVPPAVGGDDANDLADPEPDGAGDFRVTPGYPLNRHSGAQRGSESPGQDEAALPAADDTATPTPEAMEEPHAAQASDTDDQAVPDGQADDDDATQVDAVAAESEGDTTDAQPPARGNWLLPQVPLAPSTPIWTDPPTAQLVPLVFVQRLLDEAEPIQADAEATPAQPIEPDEAIEE